MRVIKFRAWCEDDKVMIYDLNSPQLRHGELKDDMYEFMQFTGTNDKNGKEIYDGDILKIDNDGEDYITHVRYENGTLSVDAINEDYSYTAIGWLQDWCEIEVIGNIQENPELLEVAS